MGTRVWETLNKSNELNVVLVSTQLQDNAQQEKYFQNFLNLVLVEEI
jgi:hypothetical protein